MQPASRCRTCTQGQRKFRWLGASVLFFFLFFPSTTRAWLRIIALSDALRLSAPLCTTTLIRLLPWLMATSPPSEGESESLSGSHSSVQPGPFHHFFISASTVADSDMQKSLKMYFISLGKIGKMCPHEKLHTCARSRGYEDVSKHRCYESSSGLSLLIRMFAVFIMF